MRIFSFQFRSKISHFTLSEVALRMINLVATLADIY